MRNARESAHSADQGAEKIQKPVQLRLLPGPVAPWRRLWDWLLAPEPPDAEHTEGKEWPGVDVSNDKGDTP